MPSRTVTVAPERLAGWLERFADRHGPADVVAADESRVAIAAPDGARAELAVIFPPMPPGPDPLSALVAHALRERTVGVLLVRRGGYAVGVFRGRELVASKVGSRHVQGRTKAGGWSQQRFARRRANQAQAVWANATETAAAVLAASAPDLRHALDAVVIGGDRDGLDQVLRDPRLATLRPIVQDRVLAVPDPRLSVLVGSAELFRAVPIILNERAQT